VVLDVPGSEPVRKNDPGIFIYLAFFFRRAVVQEFFGDGFIKVKKE